MAEPSTRLTARSAAASALATSPIERLLRRNTLSFLRRVVGTVIAAVVVLGTISLFLAWHQYDQGKAAALNDLEARAVAVSEIVDTYFDAEIGSLNAIARTPLVTESRVAEMGPYFRRLEASKPALFSGAISWIDLHGQLEATSGRGPLVDLAKRQYVREVLAHDAPYVSSGLVGLTTGKAVVVIAVPTDDRQGKLSGVLTGSLLLGAFRENRQTLELGYGGLEIVDRDGHELLAGLTPVRNLSLLKRIRSKPSGAVASSRDLAGNGDQAVAYANSTLSGWTVILERPRSALFASAWNSLLLELASLGAVVLVVFGLLALVVRRSRRDADLQEERALGWGALTSALSASATPAEVAEALLTALARAFGDAIAVVGVEEPGGQLRVAARTRLRAGRTLREERAALERVAELARAGARGAPIEDEPSIRTITASGLRQIRALNGLPIRGGDARPIGSLALLTRGAPLEEGEWALLASFAEQAGLALERAGRFAHEHELALRLQRSLLPERLPSVEGAELSGHYHAGGPALEVGGDWYDAVRRPDGVIQLCVGDVSGRGIGPATVMGRQRNIFHVCAYETLSPAEIIRRLIRYTTTDEMITLVCVSLDPYRGRLTYASAGHPPALLVDHDSGSIMRLSGASAPPIGVADPSDIVEASVPLPARSVLAMYTDGLIERRGANIDDGIDLLGNVIAAEEHPRPSEILAELTDAIGAPDDDVALLLARLEPARMPFDLELPAQPDSLATIRRRLREWLARRGFARRDADEIILATSEACNNAIEHAYREAGGVVRLRVEEEPELIRLTISDEGEWRENAANEQRGRGIQLMNGLMDVVELSRGLKGTSVTLERQLRSRAGDYATSAAQPSSAA